MAIQKIELVWVNVSDLKKSVDFFKNTLNLNIHQMSEEFGWAEVVGKDGGCLLGLAQGEKGQTDSCCDKKTCQTTSCGAMPGVGQNAVVAFTVDNLDTTIAECKKAGVVFVDEILEIPGGPRMISFTDPDGNLFQLVEPCEMERKSRS